MPAGADAVAIRVNRGGVGLDLADRMFVDLQEELAVAGRVPSDEETSIEGLLPQFQAVPAQRSGHGAKQRERFGWIEARWH